METKHRNSLLPFAIITFIYFIVGFLTTVNEQLQAPLKFTFSCRSRKPENTFTTLISFLFLSGLFTQWYSGSKWVNAYGYKNTILRGLLFMMSGLCMYLCSSWFGYQYPHLAIHFGNTALPYGFIIFVIGSYLKGTSAAIIQVVVNPYAAAYELPEHSLYRV
jgi:FHS family L-fucose permease-like MFS transporter